MKTFNSLLLMLPIVFAFISCSKQTEICECFETRLEIKQLLKESKNPSEFIETEQYKDLKAKKEDCLINIEPAYFEEKEIERNGRNDKNFLLEELGDCAAVKELLGVE